jgi:hypothetical protein
MPEEEIDYRKPLRDLTQGLRPLHKALLDNARAAYERVHGEVASAGQLLQLVAHDPEFFWLRRMSVLMVEIDEIIEGEELTREDAKRFRTEVEALIQPASDDESEYARHYRDALQNDPNVVMEHSNVRRILSALPTDKKPAEVKEEKSDG